LRTGKAARPARRDRMTPLPQPRPYRLVIADDHAVVRAGIAALLEGAGGLTVVAHAPSRAGAD
jgi:hypothetical protein